MRSGVSRMLAALAVMAGALALGPATRAVPVSLDLTGLYAIQTYPLDKSDEQAYLLLDGIANGKDFSTRVPKETWQTGPKKIVATSKAPVELWKGDLADGEFALITVTLMQGKGADAAKTKEYLDGLQAAEKKVAERAKPKLAQADFEKLVAATLEAERAFITDIKKIFSREKNTDHYGGLFTVVLWNKGGKITKRLDPVGLTFGEKWGFDPKIYSKIKNTRKNVLQKDENGEWNEGTLGPLSEDNGVRVKMTEVELIKKGPPVERNTTDYVVEVSVKADGKTIPWELGGEQPGPTEVHQWWDWAE